MLHPHDDSHAYRFCPRCGGALERRVLKADRARAPGVHALRVRLLSRSEDRRRHDHPATRGRIVLVPSRHRAGLRQVGVSRRLRRPRRAADRRGDPRSARGMRPRRPARRARQHLLLSRPRAGDRRLRGHGARRHAVRRTTSASRRRSSSRRRFRGTISPSAARTKGCATTWTARVIPFPAWPVAVYGCGSARAAVAYLLDPPAADRLPILWPP